MTPRTPARLLAAVALSSIVLASLSGCFLLPVAPSAQQTQEAENDKKDEDAEGTEYASIGDCWQAEATDMAEWAAWEGGDPVDCADDHQSYTFFAGELKNDVDEAWEDGGMSSELASAVSAQCDVNLRKLGITPEAQRVALYFFVAPEDEWDDGDRSIRCDLTVTAIDSDWYDPELEDLPADIDDLVDDIDKNPVSYEFCLIGDGFGPYESSEAYLADCDGEYYWRFAEAVYLDYVFGDPYPTEDELFAFAEEACPASGARDGEEPLYYVPSPEMWDEDYGYVDCWYSTIEQPTSPV